MIKYVKLSNPENVCKWFENKPENVKFIGMTESDYGYINRYITIYFDS